MAGELPGPPDNEGHGSDRAESGGPPPPRTFVQRMSQTFLNPPKAKAQAKAQAQGREEQPERELTDAEKRARITQIDDTERKLGYAASILAAVIALITFVPFINNPALTIQKTTAPLKGHTCPTHYEYAKVSGHFTCVANVTHPRSYWLTELAILLIFAVAVFITTRIRRRAALAFATLMTGLAMLSVVQSVLAFPFIFLGGWLLIRAWRVQRYGSPTAKGPTRTKDDGGTGGARGTGTKPAAARGNGRSGRGRRGAKKPAGPTRPAPSKRYTPKAPPRRRVPPSD
ncbi:MAG TPA: hypothetical protein VMU76_06350 [Acidimicrobiales bacterium]|nr:hypothetical protein [Acidimicrobiales bacterium]